MAAKICKALGLGLSVAVACGVVAWYLDLMPRTLRPCEEGEDPATTECQEKVEEINWADPSFALVGSREIITELRWYKGKLGHPIARLFGGHHSALVATGASGTKVRIEKFGLGTVEYCPTRQNRKCNFHPGTVYKAAGGRYLNNITWGDLHKFMMLDLDHYDVVDANCHHAVQRTWNQAVIPAERDESPAPDDSIVAHWHDFLHWFHGTAEDPKVQAHDLMSYNGTVQIGSFLTHASPITEAARQLDSSNGTYAMQFDDYNVRRRRRTQNSYGERCHGSSVGDGANMNNCPHRESSSGDIDSSNNGGPVSKKESESFGSKRWRCFLSKPIMLQKHCSGMSDSFYQRSVCCGKEYDYFGSMHKRKQSSRPSSQESSTGSEESSNHDILPMDPARIRSNSKEADASSVCLSEIGHSQAGRSSADDANACNSLLEGATSSSTDDFICQWTCDDGDITLSTPARSTFKCRSDEDNAAASDHADGEHRRRMDRRRSTAGEEVPEEDTVDISLEFGSQKGDCLLACVAEAVDCSFDPSECNKKCDYLASAALNAGHAVCQSSTGAVTSSVNEIEETEIAATEIVGLIGWIILCICCQIYAPFFASKKKKDGESDAMAVVPSE